MKLFYFAFEDGSANFGDSLNPWLWNQFIAEALDQDETTAFIGIGTILNGNLPYKLPQARNFVVFSSGVGYGYGTIPAIDSHWKIYCVRGPLSAQQLGLPDRFAIADGALLLRRVYASTAAKAYSYSFMPHIQAAMDHGEQWAEICERAGVRYIDPRLPTETILDLLSQTEVVLAEAMHGAIAAEALRVPWIPVRTHADIFTFKWVDWCHSVGLEYMPADVLSPLHPGEADPAMVEIRKEKIVKQLSNITQHTEPSLASEHRIESLTNRLEESLDQFKQDVKSNNHLHHE